MLPWKELFWLAKERDGLFQQLSRESQLYLLDWERRCGPIIDWVEREYKHAVTYGWYGNHYYRLVMLMDEYTARGQTGMVEWKTKAPGGYNYYLFIPMLKLNPPAR